MIPPVIEWIDILWLPLTLLVVYKDQRIMACAFIVTCLMSLRIQQELLDSFGFGEQGLTGWIETAPYIRGLITYSVMIMLYLVLSYFSPRTHGSIYLATSITIYIFAFVASMLIMAL